MIELFLLATEKVIIKTELKRLDAMPAFPDSSRKSPKIMPNDEEGPTVVI